MELIGHLFPGLAAAWWRKRAAAVYAQRLYQAATTSQYHPRKGDSRSGNAVMEHARHNVTYWARYLEENSDLAIGVLDDLTDRVVGTGIVTEPLIRDRQGNPLEDLNATVRRAWDDWGRRPEVSQVVPWGELQRLLFRSKMRDGEVLCKHVQGVRNYRYPGPVRYAVDCLEADYLPFDYTQGNPSITHGIERDGFGTITAYHLLKRHPGEYLVPLSVSSLATETVSVPADALIHLRFTRRLGQLRGISVFHGCVHRLQDLTDYEESERLAAKIAAAFSAVITKSPDMPGVLDRTTTDAGDRSFEMTPAMVFDNLLPGEKVETIASNRPSNALPDYRSAMLRAVSSGTGSRYSTIARTWESSYTAMRQETVATMPGTDRMQDYFVARAIRPIYERWLSTAILDGTLDVRAADILTVFDADYRGPGIPWIDPLDEAKANTLAINAGLKSRRQVIREAGGDPRKVDAELEMDPRAMPQETEDAGLETA